MKKLKSNYKLVKEVVERIAEVDLTAKSRKHQLPYIRYVYYRICKDFDKDDFMISHCSMEIFQKHDLAIYGLKRFDDYKSQTFFAPIMELYKECTLELESELAKRIKINIMKATEIRVGNLFIGMDGKVAEWSLFDFGLMNGDEVCYPTELDEIIKKPIQLTEDWLLKFGFELDEDYGDIKYYKICSRFGVCFDHEEITFYRNGFKNKTTTLLYDEPFFQHVHQLQNLYFALTGIELKIK